MKIVLKKSEVNYDEVSGPLERWDIDRYYRVYFYSDPACTKKVTLPHQRRVRLEFSRTIHPNSASKSILDIWLDSGKSYYEVKAKSSGLIEYGITKQRIEETYKIVEI